jgi:hypothetical protein
MKKDYSSMYGSKDTQIAINARQQGGAVPTPQAAPAQGAAPQGGGEQADPQALLESFIQAMQAGDQQAAAQIAMQFTSVVAQSMMQEQQQMGQMAAALRGGSVPSFDKNGNRIK